LNRLKREKPGKTLPGFSELLSPNLIPNLIHNLMSSGQLATGPELCLRRVSGSIAQGRHSLAWQTHAQLS
jgi:hypothetical protein